MPAALKYVLIAVIGYLLGNFQTGVIVSKRLGNFDVRERGSGNAGTTNVLRTMGWLPSVLTMLGDILKGALGALFGLLLMGRTGACVGGLCAILGHNWPALYNFRGGKGIATSEGAILVLDPLIALCLLVCQSAVLAATHIMSVASIVSCILNFVLTLLWHRAEIPYIAFSAIAMLLALFSHRQNIVRLVNRRENALDFGKIKDLGKKK
ncbi:MAG: glycerol-3-phosphate 1-O-acyltransferase PlsY [Clostridia bacterium]|nr:glycerol-3-phosphate 1-O-acyltransferase PlsY [Clostridia bacterium]